MVDEVFEFGEGVLSKIIAEIEKAESYVRIVVFQMQNFKLIDALIKKVKNKVKVEVITLPFTSIYGKEIEKEVNEKFQEFSKFGGKLYTYDWNIGTTEHTKSVSGPWYGLHAKFIVTDKAAIILSANLTNESEVDASIINSNKNMIKEFNLRFEEVKEDYIGDEITKKIKLHEKDKNHLSEIFTVPKHLKKDQKSILHYPMSMCKKTEEIKETIYMTPFDCIGRDFIKKIIEEAKEFAYICTERFTDEDFFYFLEKMKLEKKDIQVLAKFKSQDYQYKIRKLAKDSIALGIKLGDMDIHAKLIITDKLVAVGSINFNQMNLGFIPKKGFLRGNTEVIYITRDKKIIKDAREKFLNFFNLSTNVIDKITEKEGGELKKIMKHVLGMKKFADKKEFIKECIREEVENRKQIIEKMVEIRNKERKEEENQTKL